ncbi:uncharacterized protein PFL1_03591 [Pseudozyma flocculosa PF-1]|uniref:DNA replication complex GINS protein PSF3 n=2 Tax=Pseudozyma flocculosa TaxID=84751 RepID=A0A5C3F6U7_9BASI|nr:uncharacterized protein PFL1_03591 [Pseudozyma flocculosa PF-1]EPQ28788.1 hypothetical protein PFL1_03591 [Pseudozyma flocculosa PF-1]SPO39427.1 related to PSF3 - subunit of the GINS complex [Pseudozyma flocculosa]
MDRSYWSIDSIIADASKLPCTFNIDVHNLGHLQSTDEDDIKQHARLELPFWLAELLALNDVVSLTMPKAYGPRVKAALDANPTSVQLRQQNNNWYALGMRLANLMDSDELMDVLSKAYTGRLAQIYEQTQHLSSSSSNSGGGAGSSSSSSNKQQGANTGSSTNRSGQPGGGGGDDDDPLTASAAAIAAMVHDGPALGSSAGSGMSAEMAEFFNGLDDAERNLLSRGHQAARMMKEYLAAAAPR